LIEFWIKFIGSGFKLLLCCLVASQAEVKRIKFI